MAGADKIAKRRTEDALLRLVLDDPVVALQGPRSVGKSTLLRAFAQTRGVDVVDLDDPAVRDAVTASPALATSGPRPICIDEYQRATEVLDTLKARLNAEGAIPGTAVITGSTRHDAIPQTAQALTGRLHVLNILPLSQGEIGGTFENLLPALFTDPHGTVAAHPTSTTTRAEYIERVCAGGFPLALRRIGAARDRWFDDYARLTLGRDAVELARVYRRQDLRRLFERLVGQTGQVLNLAQAGRVLEINRETVTTYARLLEDLFLVHRLESWGTTLSSRTRARPKIHVVDSGLGSRVMRLTPAKLASLDPAALSELGHILETFVVNELMKQGSWQEVPPTFGHWRTADALEVDLVAEADDGSVVAFEVKTSDRVASKDTAGLRSLRELLGERFVAGVVLHMGPRSFTMEDRIHALPIDRLWRTV